MSTAFLYEHPTWSDQLLPVLDARLQDLVPVNVAELSFATDTRECGFTSAINRINIMPSAERPSQVVFQTHHYLSWLEQCGVRVINGSRAHATGSSKALQNGVFSSLRLAHPKGIAIYRQEDALQAADQIGYPIIIKPNIGGSGAGIGLYENRQDLFQAIQIKALDLGVDRTGLVQQYIHSDGFVYRVEVLGDDLFYSIKQPVVAGQYNYCAADGCSTDHDPEAIIPSPTETNNAEFDFCALDSTNGIELHQPQESIIKSVVEIIKASGADFGGVEYFIDSATNQPCYYDFNPYSNFVSDGEQLLGFSPEQRFADFICGILDQFSTPPRGTTKVGNLESSG